MTAWHNFSLRERMLIALAALLALAFIAWQGAIKPVFVAKAQAVQAHQAADRDLAYVKTHIGALAKHPARSGTAPFDRSALIKIARDMNVTISRVEPRDDIGFDVRFDNIRTESLYVVLQQMEADYATSILRLRITRQDDGQVNAEVSVSTRDVQ